MKDKLSATGDSRLGAVIRHPQSDLLDTKAAAAVLGIEPTTLEVWRCHKRHQIPYLKIGRLVRYRRQHLEDWLASQTIGIAA